LPPIYFGCTHDFTPSLTFNVASYGVILAEKLGFAARTNLRRGGGGNFFHDIGRIFSKPAKLDAAERAIIETTRNAAMKSCAVGQT